MHQKEVFIIVFFLGMSFKMLSQVSINSSDSIPRTHTDSTLTITSCSSPSYKHYFQSGEYETKSGIYLDKFISEICNQFDAGRTNMVIHIYSSASNHEKDTCCGGGHEQISEARANSLKAYLINEHTLKKFQDKIVYVLPEKFYTSKNLSIKKHLQSQYVTVSIE